MPRQPRIDLGGYTYHVINRANGRRCIFSTEADYKDFEYLLFEVKKTHDMRILAYVIMPNHWHLLLYPRKNGDISRALQSLCTSHALRHHTKNGTLGEGHVYQGRYKSFIIQQDRHLLTVLKYIERNPVRAKLCGAPEEWRWGSAYRRIHGSKEDTTLLTDLPIELPREYRAWINAPEISEELKVVRHSVSKSKPYGENLNK